MSARVAGSVLLVKNSHCTLVLHGNERHVRDAVDHGVNRRVAGDGEVEERPDLAHRADDLLGRKAESPANLSPLSMYAHIRKM